MVANITFLSFLLFSMCQSIQVVVNTWLNCSFYINFSKNRNFLKPLTPRPPNPPKFAQFWSGHRVGYNGTPMRNAIWDIKWSHDKWRHVTPNGQGRDIWSQISRQRFQIGTWFQWSINRKPHMGNRIVTWSMTSRDLESSRSWPQYV